MMDNFRKILRQCCEESSMKALPKLIRGRTHFQRFVWLIALLGGLTVATYQLIGIVGNYLNYSTTVNMSPVEAAPPFPDVSVCKMDAEWSFKELERKLKKENLFEAYRQKLNEWVRADGNVTPAMRRLLSDNKGYYQNIPEIYDNLDYLRDIFIANCGASVNWEFGSCLESHRRAMSAKTFLDPFYGLCTTLQASNANLNSLSLLLYLDDFEAGLKTYTFNPTERMNSKGVRVVVHPHGSFPDIFLATYHAIPGTQSNMMLNSAKHTELSAPYGSCLPSPTNWMESVKVEPYARHMYECFRLCGKHYILKHCGCLDFFYPTTAMERKEYPMCGFIHPTNRTITLERMRCAGEKIQDLYIPDQMYALCKCPTYCDRFEHHYTVEQQPWPTETSLLSFYEQMIRNASFSGRFGEYERLLELSRRNETEAMQLASQTNLIGRNFLEVHIHNHQRSYFHYTESPLVSQEALFGNIGGILNLWVGITFITTIEVMDFIYRLVMSRNDVIKENQCEETECMVIGSDGP